MIIEAPLTMDTGTRNYELLILGFEEGYLITEVPGGSCDQNQIIKMHQFEREYKLFRLFIRYQEKYESD